jgi:hypothetical protein
MMLTGRFLPSVPFLDFHHRIINVGNDGMDRRDVVIHSGNDGVGI